MQTNGIPEPLLAPAPEVAAATDAAHHLHAEVGGDVQRMDAQLRHALVHEAALAPVVHRHGVRVSARAPRSRELDREVDDGACVADQTVLEVEVALHVK